MKILSYLIGVCLLLGAASCRQSTPIQSNLEINGLWNLDYIVEANDTVAKPHPYKAPYEVTLNFKDKGELEATSSNNFITGFYEVSEQNTIQIGGGGTDRTETKWGDLFVNALPEINLYELKPNRLVLFYDSGNQLVFSRGRK